MTMTDGPYGAFRSTLSPFTAHGASPMGTPSETFVRRTSEKSRPLSGIAPTAVDDVGERTCRFLRRLHPVRTAENVAADLRAWRVKPATISKMLERESTPSTGLMLALMCVYGPDFLCAVLPTPPEWMDRARRLDRQQACEARIAALTAELEDLR